MFCFLIDELGEFYIFWIQALHFIYMLLKCFLPVCVCLFMFLSVSFEEQSGSGKSKGWLDSVCILKAQGMLMNWMWGMRERKGSRMTSGFLTEQLKGWSLLRWKRSLRESRFWGVFSLGRQGYTVITKNSKISMAC